MRLLSSALAILLATLSTATAQTTCDILASNLQQDVLQQGSTAEQFNAQQSIVCSQENSSWGAVENKSFNGSLSVPKYVDGVLGTNSTDQNWGQNFKTFCSLQAGTVALNQAASKKVRQASNAAYNAIVACVQTYADQRGIFGHLQVNKDHTGFTMNVRHRTGASNDWKILGITPTPQQSTFK